MEIGSMLLDRYEILGVVGVGGMATVYKAKCHTLDRLVAIKELKDEYASDDEFVKKFMNECQAAAKLNHPNIVSIYDFHKVEIDVVDHYFIIMEYIDGETLKDLIAEKSPIEQEQALIIAGQILAALKEAHSHGVIHRDIKPHNIMITKNGIVKVTDFGIARATSNQTMTTTMDAMGSVHYFSPEQARGAYTDQRTDIYSFGILLYEMVTGKRHMMGRIQLQLL
ncbi:MAG: protein kinase domain-containing protein [Ezakiella massiliensis]